MEEYVIMLAGGIGAICLTIGYMLGIVTKRFLSPSVKELTNQLAMNEEYYKTQLGRLKRRAAEYEQPPDMMQLASQMQGMDLSSPDAINMLVNNLGSVKGIPKWLRPVLPGIMSYVKENPEMVQQLVNKFINQRGEKSSGEGGDYL